MAGKALGVYLKFINTPTDEEFEKMKAQIASHVTDFFKGAAKHAKGISGVTVSTTPAAGSAKDIDVVCYVLKSQSDSLVQKRFGVTISSTSSGNTVWSPDKSMMLSEVYLDKNEGDAQKAKLNGFIICHELMHNKLDTYPPNMPVADIHKIKDGSVSKDNITSSDAPSEADMKAMALGLPIAVPQHTQDL